MGRNFLVILRLGGGGQISNTFFESGGKCPPLLFIRGADVLIYHFSLGDKCPREQMSYTLLRRLHIKFGFDSPSGFREEDL